MRMIKNYVIFCIFNCLLSFGQCCSCRDSSFIDHFCHAGFVAHTRFIMSTINDTNYEDFVVYSVKFLKVYKTNKDFEKLKSKKLITTGSFFGSCGIYINSTTEDKEWAIFGYAHNDKLSIGLCGGNEVWSKDVKRKLETIEKSNFNEFCQKNGTKYINDYCLADFVAHVNMTPNGTSSKGNTKYSVEYIKVYKSNGKLEKAKHKNVIFADRRPQLPGRGFCNIEIDIHDKTQPIEATFFGKTNSVVATVNSCEPIPGWDDNIKEELENGVLGNVNCTHLLPLCEEHSTGSISIEWDT